MVVVDLAMAVICFLGTCHPALVGSQTPRGFFVLDYQATDVPGYGGDLLVFQEDDRHLWAIHRVYTAKPSEQRVRRLEAGNAAARRDITHGCVNVMPEVYEQLIECCSRDSLVIR